ncbi:MAG: TetR/AcrR family transcriptional regulator [Burkholderiales bacterium]|nr:TetR/AcrR family transcriptional regulator [Burkholderiales bacterium]
MATGRPIEFDPDRVVGAATRAFWAKGYEATSLQDLLEATHLSKSSLYQAFGGKQQLFGRCIAAYTDRMVAMLRQRLESSDTPLGFIRTTLVEIGSEGAHKEPPIGCLIMNTAAEFGQREPVFAEWVDAGITRIRAVMEKALERGQRAGEVTRSRSAAALADYLMSSIAGLRTMVKAGTPTKKVLNVVDLVVSTLK